MRDKKTRAFQCLSALDGDANTANPSLLWCAGSRRMVQCCTRDIRYGRTDMGFGAAGQSL